MWFDILKKTYLEFKYRNISSEEIIDFMDNCTKHNLRPIFDQYLNQAACPVLLIKSRKKKKGVTLKYRWKDTVETFKMPVYVTITDKSAIQIIPENTGKKVFIPECSPDEMGYSTDLFYFEVED